MATSYTIKTAVVPLLRMPTGASFEISVPMDESYDLTGKRVEFAMRVKAGHGDNAIFYSDSTTGYITIADQLVTISIPPSAESTASSSVLFSTITEAVMTEYRIDFLASEGQPVDVRLQGEVEWLPEEGDWND